MCNNTITKDLTTPQVCRYSEIILKIGQYLMKLRHTKKTVPFFWATLYMSSSDCKLRQS